MIIRETKLNLIFKTILLITLYTVLINAQSHPQIAVPDGYANSTTGGDGGEVITVSSGSEFKSACESSGKKIIVVQGDLGDIGSFGCSSDKTIVGTNQESGFKGNLTLSGVDNVIIQNLTITNPDGVGTGDGIEASSECTNIFVTKCTFIDCADGSFDIKRGTDYVTVSWCRFKYPNPSGHDFPNLIGHSDSNGDQDRGKLHVTMHHNWYDDGVVERMPRVRFGHVHVYNNYYNSNNSNYCIGLGVECHIRLENCHFDNIEDPWADYGGSENGELGWNNLIFEGCSQPTFMDNVYPEIFDPPYDFYLDSPGDLEAMVTDPDFGAGNTGLGEGETFSLDVSVVQGEGSVSPEAGNYRDGEDVTVTATPETGWLFDHWGGALSGNTNPETITMDGDKSVSAYFTEDPREYYTVTANCDPGGSVSQDPEGDQLVEGTNVTITANPAQGWEFEGWSGDHTGSDATYTISSLSSDVAVTASFVPQDKYNYEAENGSFNNAAAESDNSGYSGEGYVNFDNEQGSSLDIPVYVDDAGEKVLIVTFANGSEASRPMSVSVDGTQQLASVDFEVTGEWTSWQTKQITLTLPQGASIITFLSTGDEGGPNIDKIVLDRTPVDFQENGKKLLPVSKNNYEMTLSSKELSITSLSGQSADLCVYRLNGERFGEFSIQGKGKHSLKFDRVMPAGIYLIYLESSAYKGVIRTMMVK